MLAKTKLWQVKVKLEILQSQITTKINIILVCTLWHVEIAVSKPSKSSIIIGVITWQIILIYCTDSGAIFIIPSSINALMIKL